MPLKDKEKRRSYQREYGRKHYQKNRQVYMLRAKLHDAQKNKVIKGFLLNHLRSHPCLGCGEFDPIVLEFDHREGVNKKFAIADAAIKGWSLSSVIEEIEKCDVLCANCHRRVTYHRSKRTHRG